MTWSTWRSRSLCTLCMKNGYCNIVGMERDVAPARLALYAIGSMLHCSWDVQQARGCRRVRFHGRRDWGRADRGEKSATESSGSGLIGTQTTRVRVVCVNAGGGIEQGRERTAIDGFSSQLCLYSICPPSRAQYYISSVSRRSPQRHSPQRCHPSSTPWPDFSLTNALVLRIHIRVRTSLQSPISLPSSISLKSPISLNLKLSISFESLISLKFPISLESPALSSSGSSLLEERMRGRPPFSREFVTPRRVQRSTVVMNREIASGYVLIPSGPFHLIISPGSTRPFDGG